MFAVFMAMEEVLMEQQGVEVKYLQSLRGRLWSPARHRGLA